METEQNDTFDATFKDVDRKIYDTPILLVDDEEDILTVFKLILQSEGYSKIDAFSRSKKALDHISSLEYIFYYKLALIDIKMPEIDGEKLYEKLKTIFEMI
jgi:CheY-like chemotaxis protein